ncbi:protein kinase [Aliikangiella sp. G2MR2-5]|uniref:serine/threonine protein kinase n=1 Tax=Aliikangiella sp. G2MR2-5 TaxID=2788943 RepID=UPI0018A9235D|nr:protein kinase [Aliikangiella sp. G2MR2-5]
MGFPLLDGYKINKEFASGGMAKIYDAVQISLNRPVAIKFLSKQLLTHREAKELFERESLIIAQLNHPNIVQVIDKGISKESQPYFVMEKLKGIDLSQLLGGGELPYSKKMDIAIQLCKGLAYAHKNGVIHRDIKPSNIIIDQHGDVKILDFGIALDSEQQSPDSTQSAVMGTQGYVAPEQIDDYSNATFVSDIFSVGVLLYDLFGKPAKDGKRRADARLDNQLPSDLVKLIKKCAHEDPQQRYQSLSSVRDELLRISQGTHLGNTVKQAKKDNEDLTKNFNLLDILSDQKYKKVYLFQKKSNKQLLVIKRTVGDSSGVKEAKYLSSLKHPNIVNIYAAVKSKQNSTVISEYLPGGSLSNQLIQDIGEQEFLVQACQICSALYFAHQNKILHGNLSPNNILLDEKQNLKLTDFGQKASANDNPEEIKAYHPPGQQGLCEQYDIYCMGAIFHHMLYGVPPGTSTPNSHRKVSFRLEKLIDSMLALDPQHRPSTAQQVLVELQRIANNPANKKLKSQMGEDNDDAFFRKRKRTRRKAQEKNSNSLWLSILLVLSLMLNVALIVRELVK